MIWTDDPVRDYDRYCSDLEERMKRLPVCDCCGERITDEYYWVIKGTRYCERCLRDFRHDTPEV